MKKKRKYLKINLYETSAVGIPAYPDAHFSIIKEISKNLYSSAERGYKEMEEIAKQNETTNVSAVSAVSTNTTNSNTNLEKELEKVEKVEAKEIEIEKLTALIQGAVENALKKSAERGLIDTEKKEDLTNLSVGELAIKSGLFKK